jgi:hypothetical protein
LASNKAVPARFETQIYPSTKASNCWLFCCPNPFDGEGPHRNRTGGVFAAAIYADNRQGLIGLAGFDRGLRSGKTRRRNAVRRTRHIIKTDLFKEQN